MTFSKRQMTSQSCIILEGERLENIDEILANEQIDIVLYWAI